MNKFYKLLLLISIVFMYDKFTPPLRIVKEQPFKEILNNVIIINDNWRYINNTCFNRLLFLLS